MTVIVVDDPELAAALERFRGEWSERSGAELTVAQATAGVIAAWEQPTCDVLIYPTRLMGQCVERGWVRPVRGSVIANEAFDVGDIFPGLRTQVITFAGKVYAVPLGSPPVLEFEEPIPSSGADANPSRAWLLGLEVVARSLARLPVQDRQSALFDPATMRARLASPAFEQAVEAMQAKAAESDRPLAPHIGWLGLLPAAEDQSAAGRPLPSEPMVFETTLDRWQRAESSAPVSLLGASGRVASVTASTRNAASAFRLLRWLGSGEIGLQVSIRSRSTAPFRQSQLASVGRWPAASGDPAALEALLRDNEPFVLPRVQGIDDYLTALGDSVAAGGPAADVLRSAEAAWEEITERLGRPGQVSAYRGHLNLSTTAP